MGFTTIDSVILAVVLLSGVFGVWRGLVKEILSMAGWLAASVALLYGFDPLKPVLRDFISNSAMADLATGAILFAGTLIVVSFITHYLSKWVKGSAFGGADRSLGFLFGLARGALIVMAVFFVYAMAMPDAEEYPPSLRGAFTLPYLQAGNDWVSGLLQRDNVNDNALEDALNSDTIGADSNQGIDPPGP